MMLELKEDDFIVSKTDLKGLITYTNEIFISLSEYSELELLKQPHNILRHTEMPKAIFKYLWETISKKQEVFAYVINRTKNNNYYWVYANITASVDSKDNIIGYYSVRRKPNPKALETIKPLYKKMLEIEKSNSIDASYKILAGILQEKGISYDEYMIQLQE